MGKDHDEIKKFVLDLGREVKDAKGRPHYKVYSGDEQPVDIRLKKRHTTYRPDVVWEYDGNRVIFVVAVQEEKRTIIGEVALSAIVGNRTKIVILTQGWSDREFNDLQLTLSIYTEYFKMKYDIDPINLKGSQEDMKSQIKKKLEKLGWV